MKHGLEPGVLRTLQLIAVLQVVLLPVLRRSFGVLMGIDVPMERWLVVSLSGPLLLVIMTWTPWAPRVLGRAFMPLFVLVMAVQIMLEKYLGIVWLTAPEQRELNALLLSLRLWVTLHTITLLVAWQYSLRWVLVTSLGLSILDGVLSLLFTQPGSQLYTISLIFFSVRTISIVTVALGVGWLLQRQREQQQALAEANRNLAHYAATAERLAISQERNRLARELHDTLAHSLSGVTVQLGAVQALWDDDEPEARSLLDQALNHTRNGLTEARRALQALRASPLEDVGLATAICNLAQETARRAQLELDAPIRPELGNLPLDKEQCIYRVAQEALTNVVRHAQATALQVSLAQDQSVVRLMIMDNGRGFDPTQIGSLHYGLKGMSERAELFGGKLEVDSQPRRGTTVRLTMPV